MFNIDTEREENRCMIKIIEVKNRKDRKEFLNFPLRMYKDNPNFVPPLYADEKKMFTKKIRL